MKTRENIKINSEELILHHSYTENTESKNFLPHYHEKCELVFLVSGEVSYVVEGKTYKLKKWDVVVSRPMQIHTILPEDGTDYDRFVAIFNPHILPREIWEKIKNGPDVYPSGAYDKVIELFAKLDFYREKFSDENFQPLAMAVITEIAFNLSLYDEEESGAFVNPIISKALEYIKDNLLTIESIEEVCASLYITKSHLHHLFTQHLQVTPAKYIMAKRLMLAQKKIKKGAKPTQIFSECGFTDYATFFRNYKNHFGYPPSLEGKITRSHEILT